MNEETVEEIEEPRGSLKPLIWTIIILIAISAFFLVGFRFFGDSSYPTIEYNGFEFYEIENMWYTQWQLEDKIFTLPLRHNPLEVEDVEIHGQLQKSFNRKNVYITFDPRNSSETNFTILSLAAAELSLSMTKVMQVNAIASCAYDVPGVCQDRPIVTCEDKDKSVILISDVGTPEILLHGDCVILKGYNMDLLKSVDRFLYQWYGIMKDERIEEGLLDEFI